MASRSAARASWASRWRNAARVGQQVVAALVGRADALQHLVARRAVEERLVGVEVDRRVGVAELVGVLVGGVVGAQVLDAPEVSRHRAQPRGLEGGHDRLGLRLG